VTLENAMVAPLSTVLYELRYSAGEGTVLSQPRGPDGRAGYALLAGSRADVTAAINILDDGAEIYRGE
jgi:hypothetical protein